MISNIDENFGRLREALASDGRERDTVLIFASDNGQCPQAAGPEPGAYNAGMRGFKGSMYEGGHRIPFVIRWPGGGVDGGRSVDVNAAYIDLMPTLLDLCGVQAPPERGFHGASLAGLARGEPAGPDWDSRVLVTDTQRVPRPIKWRLSCVMRGAWRLINGQALFDLASDPGQRTDVAAAHPEIVAELRAAYEAWWVLCERQADDAIPITLGADAANPTVLTSHDLRNDAGDGVWSQGQVRAGEACAGHWEIAIEQPGFYEFTLRRWPAEAGHDLGEGIADGVADVPIARDGIAEAELPLYQGGRALPIRAAGLEVAGQSASMPVAASEDAARLRLRLERGPAELRAWFEGEALSQSAYYVEVRRLGG
jgi:arylsulfatase B